MTFPTPAKYKKEFPFLKEIDSLALANAQLNLDKAYKNFFRDKSVGFPRFKKVRKILFRVIQRIIKMVQLL
jgi:putative transposase